MGRIKYLEAAGLEVKRGRPLVGPRQLILDEGQDLNEFYKPKRGRNEN